MSNECEVEDWRKKQAEVFFFFFFEDTQTTQLIEKPEGSVKEKGGYLCTIYLLYIWNDVVPMVKNFVERIRSIYKKH